MLGFIWTLPNTLLGLLVGALTFQRPRLEGDVIVFDEAPRGFTRWLASRGFSAMTIGHVIVSARPLQGALLTHEMVHVWQYRRLGPLFLPIYLVLSIAFGYGENPLELAARSMDGLLLRQMS